MPVSYKDPTPRSKVPPATGDIWKWRGVTITVGEIGPGGRWANIHCKIVTQGDVRMGEKENVTEWDKQQPLIDGKFPADWERISKKK